MAIFSDSASSQTKWFLIVFMIFKIVINYFWRHELFKMGNNIIYTFQQSQNIAFDAFFYTFTLMIDPVVVLVTTFALMIVVRNKYRAFVTVMFMLLNTYFAGLLKAFYADPRPFWANKAIQSIGMYCPQQYGNPSGHSWFSIIIGFAVIIQYWGLGPKFKYLYASVALMVFVPMSRMYLGAHSLNQVLQGLSLGFIMIFFFKFCGLKFQLESFLKNFNSQPKLKWKKVILLMHILYIFSFLVNQDDVNPYYKAIPNEWVQNIRNKCNKQVDTNHLNFMMLMINSLLVNLSTGLGYGFQEIIKSQKGRIYLSGRWLVNEQRHSLLFGYIYFYLIQIVHLAGCFVLPVLMVYLFGPRHSVMFIFGNLGAFLSGYFYTSRTFKYLFDNQIIRQEIL